MHVCRRGRPDIHHPSQHNRPQIHSIGSIRISLDQWLHTVREGWSIISFSGMMQLLGRNWNPLRRTVMLLAASRRTLHNVRPCMEWRLTHFALIMVGSSHLMLSSNVWPAVDSSMGFLLPIPRSRMEFQRGSMRPVLGEQRPCCMGCNFLSFCGLKQQELLFIIWIELSPGLKWIPLMSYPLGSLTNC